VADRDSRRPRRRISIRRGEQPDRARTGGVRRGRGALLRLQLFVDPGAISSAGRVTDQEEIVVRDLDLDQIAQTPQRLADREGWLRWSSAVGIRATVAVELPVVAGLGDLVEVEVADDISSGVDATSPTKCRGSTK